MSYAETKLSLKLASLKRAAADGCNVSTEINNLSSLKSREDAIAVAKKCLDKIKSSPSYNNEIAKIRHSLTYLELT